MILEGVDRYRVWEAMFEGVRVIMTYRGEPYSTAYIQGLAGSAFRIAGICPCAPTCSIAMTPQDLLRLLGYAVETVPLDEQANLSDDERQARMAYLQKRVKADLDAKRPCLLWHAFTSAEWDVVCGYDETTQEFLGRGSYAGREQYAHEPQTRPLSGLEICPAFGAILVGAKTGTLNAHEAEVSALREAVRHAHDARDASCARDKQWVMLQGIQCYDRWVDEYQHDPAKVRGLGDCYCLEIYRTTHRAAGGFMRELAAKYAQPRVLCEQAAAEFSAEADTLDQCVPLLDWESPAGPDVARNAAAGALLAQARDHYVAAMGHIEQALTMM
jgi:hypothetical protein